jgi:hypothetical protein
MQEINICLNIIILVRHTTNDTNKLYSPSSVTGDGDYNLFVLTFVVLRYFPVILKHLFLKSDV